MLRLPRTGLSQLGRSLLGLALLSWAPRVQAQAPITPPDQGPPRHYEAVRAVGPIEVDGSDDDPSWELAKRDDRFQQRRPELGADPPVRTTFRVVYDENALYVFVEAWSNGPKDIVVRTLRRDSFGIFGDDTIAVKIDPHHDRRSAHTFAANSDGAQVDTMTLEDGRVGIREWDAVWQVEGKRHDWGYTMEFRIPFAVMGIKSADEMTLGFEVTRDHSRPNATYDWRVIVPPRHPAGASAFGTLGGLKGIKSQRALEFTPYLAGRSDFRRRFELNPLRNPNLSAGADARVQVGTGSYIEASILTDFAQVEADEVQVARDRFPLFFPERRPFFINGLDIFNFGRPREGQLFFSRRIGLDGGSPIPIAAGAKAYGRSGPLSYGFLQVQTLGRQAERPIPGEEEDPQEVDPGARPESYSVGRLRMQTGSRGSVGILGLGRHRFGERGYEAASAGIDAEVRSKDGKLRSYGFVAQSFAERPIEPAPVDPEDAIESAPTAAPPLGLDSSSGLAGYASMEYQGLYVRPAWFWLWSAPSFEAPLGFFRRPGTATHNARVDFAPRPRVFGLQEVRFGPRSQFVTDPHYGELLTRGYGAQFEAQWRKGWEAKYGYRHRADEVQSEFELYGYEVGADRYFGSRHEASFESPRRAFISGRINYQYIELFGGFTHQAQLRAQLRAGKHLTIGGTYTHRYGRLDDPGDRFNFGFANGNVDVAITRNLLWDTLIRYSLEPGDGRLGLQSRVRWRYRPGSDIFLVYRSDTPLGDEPDPETPREPFHELTLKMTFYLRAFLNR